MFWVLRREKNAACRPYPLIFLTTSIHQASPFFFFLSQGERDYARVAGPTGPLVYPAGHVWLHVALRALTRGGSIAAAQWVAAGLYLVSQALALGLTIASRGVPPAALPLLAASKRLHSIYVLRLFNDCWSATLVSGGEGPLVRAGPIPCRDPTTHTSPSQKTKKTKGVRGDRPLPNRPDGGIHPHLFRGRLDQNVRPALWAARPRGVPAVEHAGCGRRGRGRGCRPPGRAGRALFNGRAVELCGPGL
jgi:hypothetical protein